MGLPKGRTNNPNGRKPRTPEQMRELLISKRRLNEYCWEWTGPLNEWGYGQISWHRKHTMVHRVSAVVWMGFDLNDPRKVLHSCDNPRCFNPDHLFLGTDKDNAVDCSRKRRQYQQRKTHCINGHKFTKQNTRINASGWRICKTCHSIQEQKSRERRRVSQSAADHRANKNRRLLLRPI